MSDGKVVIDTTLNTKDVDRGLKGLQDKIKQTSRNIDNVSKSMNGMGNKIGKEFTRMGNNIGKSFDFASYNAKRFQEDLKRYGPDYAEYRALTRELSQMQRQFEIMNMKSLMPFHRRMMEVQKDMFNLSQSMGKYSGSNKQFMDEVTKLGAQYKKARDEMIKHDKMLGMSIIQTAGQMLNMTSQAKRISEGYDRMKNPLLSVNKAGLKFADSLQEMAHRGNAAVLALKRLGPNANMKQLQDEMMKITQGQMRFQQVAMASAVTTGIVFGIMHEQAMNTNKAYAAAFKNMVKNVQQALQPMVQVFANAMTHVYNFISSIAKMITEFSKAHPMIAKVVSAILLLVPALTLILSPLAVGIGLFDGLLASFSSVFTFIQPLVTGLAAMSATVWIVAGAVVGLITVMTLLWKNSEAFRKAVISGWQKIKSTAQDVFGTVGKYFDDLSKKLAPLGSLFDTLKNKVVSAFSNLGNAIAKALNGDFSGIEKIFQNMIPSIIGFLVGGIPGLIISASRFIPAIVQGIQSNSSQLSTVITNISTSIVTFFTNQFPKIITTGVQIITSIVNGITSAIPQFVNSFVQIITMLVPLIIKLLPVLMQAGIQIIMAIYQGIFTQGIPVLMNASLTIIKTLINVIAQNLPLLLSAGMQVIVALISGITQILPTLVQTSVQLITTIVNTLVNMLPDLVNIGVHLLVALIKGIVQMLPSLITASVQMITQIINVIVNNLPLIINAGIQILTALINGIVQVLPLLFNAGIQIITQIIKVLSSNLPQLLNMGLQIILAILTGIGQAFPQLQGAMNVLKSIIIFIWPIVKSLVISTWNAIVNVIQGAIKVITGIISLFSALFKGDWSKVWSSIKKIASGAVQALWGLINLWFIGKFLKPLKTFGSSAKTVMSKGWSLIKDTVSNSIKSMRTFAENSFQSLKKNLANTTSSTKTSISNGWGSLKKNVFKSASNIRTDVAREFSNMKKSTSTAASNIKADVSREFSSMKSSIGTTMGRVWTTIKTEWGKAKKFLTSINLKTVGKDIIQGLINGLKALNPATTIENIAHSLVKKFKKVLGIHSPSRVFHSLGGYILQGLVNGLSSHNLKEFGESVLKDFGGGILKGWDSIKSFFSGLLGGGSSGDVTSWLTAALGITGTPMSWLSGLQKLVKAESGGNPKAVNPTKVLGQHATGLLQMLPSTFKAFAMKGHGNILNPIDNAIASIRYIKKKYGSIFNTPLFKGGKYKGYAKGTNYHRGGLAMVGEKGRELANIPHVGLVLLGVNGPQLLNLPRGTSVIPNPETEKLLSNGLTESVIGKATSWMKSITGGITTPYIPAYADGVGSQNIVHVAADKQNVQVEVNVQPQTIYTQVDGRTIQKTVKKWNDYDVKIRNFAKGNTGVNAT